MRYSEKEKIRVVKMYYELGSIQKAIEKLGYPKRRNMVYKWIEEYKKTGRIKDKRSSHEIKQYTEEEKAFAVRFYHENQGSYQNIAKSLGYPSAAQLRLWVEGAKKDCKITPYMIEYTKENFIKAVVEFCTDEDGIVSISNKYHIAPGTIKKAASVLLSKEYEQRMSKQEPTIENMYESIDQLIAEKAVLEEERERLKQEVQKLQMERDALEVAGIMLKKYGGIDLTTMSNREKTIVIDALKEKYRLSDLFEMLDMSKSSYYYQHQVIVKPDKDDTFREHIRQAFSENNKEYGYRRIHAVLSEIGIRISEKRVRRIMKQEELKVFQKKGLSSKVCKFF